MSLSLPWGWLEGEMVEDVGDNCSGRGLNVFNASSSPPSPFPKTGGSGRQLNGIYRDEQTKAVGRLSGDRGWSK